VLSLRTAFSGFRSFATVSMPEIVDPAHLPPSLRALIATIASFTTHPLSMIR